MKDISQITEYQIVENNLLYLHCRSFCYSANYFVKFQKLSLLLICVQYKIVHYSYKKYNYVNDM